MAEESGPEPVIEALRAEFPPTAPPSAKSPKRATMTRAQRAPTVRAKRTTRGAGAAQAAALERLNATIEELIKENRKLKGQLDRLASRATTATETGIDRGLRAIQRRLQKAVSGPSRTGKPRGPKRTAATSARRRRPPSSTI